MHVVVTRSVPVEPPPVVGRAYAAYAWPAAAGGLSQRPGVLIVVDQQPVRLIEGEYRVAYGRYLSGALRSGARERAWK